MNIFTAACAIILLVASGAFAQEQQGIPPEVADKLAHDLYQLQQDIQPPQQPQPQQPQHRQRIGSPEDVELHIVINTGKDKPDVHHTEAMPKSMTRMEKIKTCTDMAFEFLSHKYPDSVDGKVLIATCIVPLNIADDAL
jgi:hypothetical protein